MNLKEYIKGAGLHMLMKKDVVTKLLELESISNWMTVMLGVELDILVKPTEPKEGRFYGKGLAEDIRKTK